MEGTIVETKQAKASLAIGYNGTREVSVYELATIPTPPSTRTYQAVPHIDLTYEFDEAAYAMGWERKEPDPAKAYKIALNADNSKMFAVTLFNIPGVNLEYGSVACGIRNSYDKSFSLSIMAGDYVGICTNYHMAATITMAHKHNWSLSVHDLIHATFENVPYLANRRIEWMKYLREAWIDEYHGVSLLAEAVERKALPVGDFMDARYEFLSAYSGNNPQIERGGTVWSAYQAITSQYKKHPISRNGDYTVVLDQLIKQRYGIGK